MLMIEYKDIGWGNWVATAVLLTMGIFGHEQVVVGAEEIYEARCRLHFEPPAEDLGKLKNKNQAGG